MGVPAFDLVLSTGEAGEERALPHTSITLSPRDLQADSREKQGEEGFPGNHSSRSIFTPCLHHLPLVHLLPGTILNNPWSSCAGSSSPGAGCFRFSAGPPSHGAPFPVTGIITAADLEVKDFFLVHEAVLFTSHFCVPGDRPQAETPPILATSDSDPGEEEYSESGDEEEESSDLSDGSSEDTSDSSMSPVGDASATPSPVQGAKRRKPQKTNRVTKEQQQEVRKVNKTFHLLCQQNMSLGQPAGR